MCVWGGGCHVTHSCHIAGVCGALVQVGPVGPVRSYSAQRK